jgi:hypothetical protein
MKSSSRETRDLIAQWAFDARPILGRFHLWLENVEITWVRGEPRNSPAISRSWRAAWSGCSPSRVP